MKKLLLLCLFLIASITNAQIALGGEKFSDGGSVPIRLSSEYNYTQQIFNKDEISANAAGNITGIKFYLPPSTDLSKAINWRIYLGHTTKTVFSGGNDWVPPSSLTQVFTGAVSESGGEMTITFNTPFAYNNTDNLVIAIHENNPGSAAYTNFFYSYKGVDNSTMVYNSNFLDVHPLFPAPGFSGDLKSVATLLGLTAAVVPSCPVVSFPDNTVALIAPVINWLRSSSALSYRIKVGTTPGGSDVLNMQDLGTSNSFAFTNQLNFNTKYYYTVYAVNSAGVSACTERTFTTVATLDCPFVDVPNPSQKGFPLKTTFKWGTSTAALGYRLSIGTSAGASDVLDNFDVGNVNTYTLSQAQQLNPSTKYYFRVTAYNGGVVSPNCFERNFTTTVAAPSNDECSGAISLPINPSLTCTNVVHGDTVGATRSPEGMGACSGGDNDDVWYKFVATYPSHIISLSNMVSTGGQSGSPYVHIAVFSGECGNLTPFYCAGSLDAINGLTVGKTYYLKIYTSSNEVNVNAGFDICIGLPPSPPVNDNCVNAIPITINPDMNCGSMTSGTTLGGTKSLASVSACTGYGDPDDDVWYKFTATATGHTFQLKNITSVGNTTSTSLIAQVFSGACNALVSTFCINNHTNYTFLNGLVPGQTYYVRFYNNETNYRGAYYASSFDICMGTLPKPVNDECSGAVELSVSPTLACTSPVSGTTLGATNSGLAVAPCSGSADDDVWYKFTAVASEHVVMLSNINAVGTSASKSLYTQFFSGACGTLTSIKCSTLPNTTLRGLTPGDTYYVRVYDSNANGTTVYADSFNICVGTLPPPPANDECVNAIPLTVSNTDAFVNPVNGSLLGATPSIGAPACSSFVTEFNGDIWYSFTASASMQLVHVLRDPSIGTEVLTGTCGNLTSVRCHPGSFGNANVLLLNLNVGQTYYVRVFMEPLTTPLNADFQIAVTTPSVVTNDVCSTAIPIGYDETVQGVNALANDDLWPSNSCSNMVPPFKGVWFKVTATENGPIVLDACGTQFESSLNVYTGACGALACDSVNIIGSTYKACTANPLIGSKITFMGVAGTTYYIMLNGRAAWCYGNYTISMRRGVLATEEVERKKEDIKVYPNPFTDVLKISNASKVKSVSIVELSGKLVKTIEKPSSELQLADLKQGMYLVVLHMKDGSKQVVKSIKK
ncbi:T9SS type A sorting domain-containing protein [Chryseobacterium sp. MYb328]|uniref:T9SS type A sorting domain-containing protein n=1 Tax=Chryseobacterium sp. MYb328 TaxID=2745231 RepID=UPI0030A5B8D0